MTSGSATEALLKSERASSPDERRDDRPGSRLQGPRRSAFHAAFWVMFVLAALGAITAAIAFERRAPRQIEPEPARATFRSSRKRRKSRPEAATPASLSEYIASAYERPVRPDRSDESGPGTSSDRQTPRTGVDLTGGER